MPDVLYTVSIDCPDHLLHEQMLGWLIGGHVRQVIDAGARSADVAVLDPPHPQDPGQIVVRYIFASRESFADYERDHAPALRQDGQRLFGPDKRIRMSRSLGVLHTSFGNTPGPEDGGPIA